jgi:hypothetical protein
MKKTDAMVTEADIRQVKADIKTLEWKKAIYGLLERESDLFIDISGQLEEIFGLIEATGAPPQLRQRLFRRIQIAMWTSIIVLDRSHRRLWDGFLPDDGSEPPKPKGKRK